MPELDAAERIWCVVEPVWRKHAGTRVPDLLISAGGCQLHEQYFIPPSLAEMLCESGLLRWLAEQAAKNIDSDETELMVGINDTFDKHFWTVWLPRYPTEVAATAPSLLEALAAACMEVPND